MTTTIINVGSYYASRMDHPEYLLKISILADKSESMETFLHNVLRASLNMKTSITLGIEFLTRDISVNRNEFVRLSLWIYHWNVQFKPLQKYYINGSLGVILIFDSTDFKSLDWVSKQVKLLKDVNYKGPILLVGNEINSEHYPEVFDKHLEKFSNENNISEYSNWIFLTTSEDAINIFKKLIRMIKIVELDEKFFHLEFDKIIDDFDMLQKAQKEVEEFAKSINVGGPKIPIPTPCIIIPILIILIFIILGIIYFS